MELDALSAWFLLLLAIVGGVATVFGVTYMRRERAHGPVAPVHAAWATLLAGMVGVLLSRSAVLFLLTWEAMAVSAYFLIMFEHGREEVRRSGLLYLVLTHLGTLGLLVMFLAWGRSAASFTFTDLAAQSRSLPWAGAGILLLALFGFGIKAGVFPFHFWLPGAHAAAPSHVSALLSGVMLKMGIYGLLRVVSLVGPPPAWWGWTLLGLGLTSALLGVLWALAQRDIKRALAYSSVENVGIILLGLGLGALGTTYRLAAVAQLGYAAALLHALNHALFKSLMFLGAGAIVRGTGTRAIDRLGGLARRMPRTAVAFMAGCIAIAGLPPLNGFVGEWTLVRGFLSAGLAGGPLRWTGLGAAGVGLVGALSLACFVRLAGSALLGKPRAPVADGTAEADADAQLSPPLALLAVVCVAIGLAPALAVTFALRAAGPVIGAPVQRGVLPGIIEPATSAGLLGALLLLVVTVAWGLRAVRFASARRASAATWGCAWSAPTPRMQYTASSFGAPILAAIPLSGSRVRLADREGTSPGDRVTRGVARLWDRIQALARTVRPLQRGRVTTYLQYIIWTVLLLLGYLLVAAVGRPS
jgi:formate hydrogenlyase subunit 3/multisubunit Na+/H+ antiporter MnhD subunit